MCSLHCKHVVYLASVTHNAKESEKILDQMYTDHQKNLVNSSLAQNLPFHKFPERSSATFSVILLTADKQTNQYQR